MCDYKMLLKVPYLADFYLLSQLQMLVASFDKCEGYVEHSHSSISLNLGGESVLFYLGQVCANIYVCVRKLNSSLRAKGNKLRNPVSNMIQGNEREEINCKDTPMHSLLKVSQLLDSLSHYGW